MDMLLFGLVLGILISGFVVGVGAVARAGSLGGVFRGLEIATRMARDPGLRAKVDAVLAGGAVAATPATPPPPPKPTGEPLRLLAQLQADARLVDFLMEDMSGVADGQLGAAVRDIHRKAAASLREHLTVGPVLAGGEGERVTVPAGFDPSAVRVVGNVTGAPPFTGELQHPGWRVTEVKLPAVAAGADGFVLQPAEVQV
jgi:hypothetical protein